MSVAILPFVVFAASQIGTPGPANMTLMATGARYGLRRALPFVAGVALGKQFIIWPIGFGLMELGQSVPWLFMVLKWASAAYIVWLAWRVAHIRLGEVGDADDVPGFQAGLLVHPLNPKAWALITAGFTSFVSPDASTLQATATIAICLLAIQIVLHPIWTFGGEQIAKSLRGTRAEAYVMWTLAILTVLSVLLVLLK